MEEIFVTQLRINKVRHLENLVIPLSETERKHLILTGKNGSGKTETLRSIQVFLVNLLNREISDEYVNLWAKNAQAHREELAKLEEVYIGDRWRTRSNTIRKGSITNSYRSLKEMIAKLFPCDLKFNNNVLNEEKSLYPIEANNFIIKHFNAKREFVPEESNGPQRIELKDKYNIDENINENFVRYLVNLRLDLLDAKDIGNTDEVKTIEDWFLNFTSVLKEIFEDESVELIFDRPNFNYNIIAKNKEPFNLNQLSDGYASFIAIITELIMRISVKQLSTNPEEIQGLVLIDEVENHLHISLQKKILPFLTSFFPKIQFIVTTHSPFVLSSIDNAVIYDLEKQQRIEDLSDYSYQELVETYFGTDQYSDYVKQKLNEYEVLIQKENRTDSEEDKLYEIRKYFRKLPFFLSPELQLKIQSLELYPSNTHD